MADGTIIRLGEAYELANAEEVQEAIILYRNNKRFGLPFSGGWMNNPAIAVNAMTAVYDAVESIKGKVNHG